MTSGTASHTRPAELMVLVSDIIVDSGGSEHIVSNMDYLTVVKVVRPFTA